MLHTFRMRLCKTADDAATLEKWLADPLPEVAADTWGMSPEAEASQRSLMGA